MDESFIPRLTIRDHTDVHVLEYVLTRAIDNETDPAVRERYIGLRDAVMDSHAQHIVNDLVNKIMSTVDKLADAATRPNVDQRHPFV